MQTIILNFESLAWGESIEFQGDSLKSVMVTNIIVIVIVMST